MEEDFDKKIDELVEDKIKYKIDKQRKELQSIIENMKQVPQV